MISFILSGLLHSWHFAWPGGIMTQGQECSCWGFSSKLGRLFLGSPSGESWLAFSGDRLFTEQARYLIMVLAPWWFAGNCNQRGGLVKSLIQPVQVIFLPEGTRRVERSSSGQKNKHTTQTNETIASSYAKAPAETSLLPHKVHETFSGCKVISFSFLMNLQRGEGGESVSLCC